MPYPSPLGRYKRGLVAAQHESLEHCDPSKVDDRAKFVLLHEKELGSKVVEIGQNIEKSICHDIVNYLDTEVVLPENTAEKGILGVVTTLFNHPTNY